MRDLEGHRVAVEGTSASDSLLMNAEGGRYRGNVKHHRSFGEAAAKAYLAGEADILAGTRAAIEAVLAAADAREANPVVELPVPGLVRTRWDSAGRCAAIPAISPTRWATLSRPSRVRGGSKRSARLTASPTPRRKAIERLSEASGTCDLTGTGCAARLLGKERRDDAGEWLIDRFDRKRSKFDQRPIAIFEKHSTLQLQGAFRRFRCDSKAPADHGKRVRYD